MIPAMNIVAWSKDAPWAEQLRFRGGTALNKLHFPNQ
jgi:predicted nucleotidyltransferase component of viral defense system